MRVITPHSYHYEPADRALADEIMHRLDLEPNTVTLMEVSETGVLIEQLVRDCDGRVRVVDGQVLRRRWRV
jgi:hypothetical protein